MIRAVLFDFYSVWTPDKFSYYLACVQLMGPEDYKAAYDAVQKYYRGEIDLEPVVEFFRVKLGQSDLSTADFELSENNISPQIVDFIRSLHAHFLKVGILGNLGNQEYGVLKSFNDQNQLLEVIASPLTLNLKTSLLDPMVFDQTLQVLNEHPDNTIYISGNPYNIDFASSRGFYTLHFEGLEKLEVSINQVLANEAGA